MIWLYLSPQLTEVIMNYQNTDANAFLLEERHELYRTVWENSPEAFILLNSEGNIIHYNKTVFKLFGLLEDSLSNNNSIFNFLLPEFISKAKEDFAYALENSELKDCEYQSFKGNLSDFPISISYRKVCFESLPGDYILALVKDITKAKIDERAIRMAKDRAEVADKLKTSFLANMSHEIRTPINAVIGFADLLNDPDLLDDEKEEYIKTIQVNGELLLKLINDIIDLAKIESGQLKIQQNEFSLSQLMEEIYISTRNMLVSYEKPHLVLEKHIDKSLDNNVLVTDQYRLMQIINNLLSNAIKFTDKGIIKFGVQVLENGKAEFYVQDSGIGIEDDDLDHIFERFGQVESSLERNISGTGLGLSITKSLVELLGGKIKVYSKPGEGSLFSFTINALNKNGVAIVDSRRKINLKGKKILIVEDTESNYRLLNILIEKQGGETIWALTGKQGIAICRNSRDIDLVLMDINLPDIDGYEATAAIKVFRPNLPIVAQTAYAMSGERERSIEFGCDDYISKPIMPDKLFASISNLIY